MLSLIALAVVLVAIWGWALAERERRAQFMHAWIHVPLITAVMAIVMAIGLRLR